MANAAIRPHEYQFCQLAAVDLGRLRAHALCGLFDQGSQGHDLACGPAGGVGHAAQHVQEPRLPCAMGGHSQQAVVVIGLVADDVAAQVKHRDAQQALVDQVQQVEHVRLP